MALKFITIAMLAIILELVFLSQDLKYLFSNGSKYSIEIHLSLL